MPQGRDVAALGRREDGYVGASGLAPGLPPGAASREAPKLKGKKAKMWTNPREKRRKTSQKHGKTVWKKPIFGPKSCDKKHSNSLIVHWFWRHGWCAFLFHWEWGCGEDVSQTWIKKMVRQLEVENWIRSKKSQSLRSQPYSAAAAASAWFKKRQVLPTEQSTRLSLIFSISTPTNSMKFFNWLEPNWHQRCHNPAEHRRQLKLDRAFSSRLFLFWLHVLGEWLARAESWPGREICTTAAAVQPRPEVGIGRFYHVGLGTPISLKASNGHWNLGFIAKGSERYLERHKPCHFKVKLALLKVDNLDFAENAFQDGVIDINSESNHHNNPWMILACSPS